MMDQYKQFAISIAKASGKIMRDNFSLGSKKDWKENDTPLTIADTTINNLVISEVQKHFPSHAVVAEEGNFLQKNAEYVWVCDPLDGTIPFSHGVALATFSLALTHKGKSILGVAYDPFLDRLYFAEKGKGALLNNEKIMVSKSSKLAHTMVTIEGFEYPESDFFAVWKILMQEKVKVASFASSVAGSMLVAAGELSASLFGWSSPWDVAAAKIIVEEAGGKCTDLFGDDQFYDRPTKGFLASNGHVHEELLHIIQSTIPGRQ